MSDSVDRILDILDVGLQHSTEGGYYVPPAPGEIDGPDDHPVATEAAEALRRLEEASSYRAPDDDRTWGLAPFSYTSMDEDPLNETNYDFVLAELTAIDPEVGEVSMKHWVGSVRERLILVPLDNPEVVERLAELVDAYESYAVLDEETYTERRDALALDALTFYDDVGTVERAGEVAAWLADRDEWLDLNDLPDDETVREALVDLGLVVPDPERGEEEPSSVELTAMLLSDIYGDVPWHPAEDYLARYINRN